jgi:hypothetical protein
MRTVNLLAIAVLMFSAGTLAQTSNQGVSASPERPDSALRSRMFHKQPAEFDLFQLDDPTGATCYTMRTYTVARARPDSDTTHLVSYTTCPKANWKLQFRNADEESGNPDH